MTKAKGKNQDGTDAPARPKATTQRKDGIGPDPVALKTYMNPEREGKVFTAIRRGEGSTVAELMAATGLRNPTVKYFGISASQADLIDMYRIGAEYRFVVKGNDSEATAKAKQVRESVLALVKATKAEDAKAKTQPAPAGNQK